MATNTNDILNLLKEEINSNEFKLNRYWVDQFIKTGNKTGGTRPGFLGTLPDGRTFMIKIEDGFYTNYAIGLPKEIVAVESLTAQLIRSIFGKQYAADIHLAKIDRLCSAKYNSFFNSENSKLYVSPYSQVYVKDENGTQHTFKNPGNMVYAIASAWVDGGKTPHDSRLEYWEEQKIYDLEIISSIFTIGDCKYGNLVSVPNKKEVFIVDCAANFKELSSFRIETEAAYKLIKKFTEFSQENLRQLLNEYKGILSDKTIENIFDNMTKNQITLKNELAIYDESVHSTVSCLVY